MGKLIDADKLKRKCQKTATEAWKMKIKASAEVIMNQFIDFIDETDAVDAVPVRRGKWIDKTDSEWDGEWDYWKCSCCGVELLSIAIDLNGTYLYCPKCGARMDGKDGGNE